MKCSSDHPSAARAAAVRRRWLTGMCFTAALGAGCADVPDGLAPDTVYLDGTVVTMAEGGAVAEAVAVKGDRIIAVGTSREVRKLAGRNTVAVDLDGRTMLPGFYAAHDHFPWAGRIGLVEVELNSPPIGTITNIPELVAALKARAEATPVDSWVIGWGYDDTLLEEQRHPTRWDLDQVSTEHPIWIQHTSGHLGVGNSRALEVAQVNRSTPSPPGGVIRKDSATGEPDGVFEEVGYLVARHIPAISDDVKWQAFERAAQSYVSQGVTTAVVTGGSRQSLMDLQEGYARGLLNFRVISMTSKSEPGMPSATEAGGILPGFGTAFVKGGNIKIVHDGSLQGYTGYLREAYHVPFGGDTTYRSYPRRDRQALTEMVVEAHREGFQIGIHGNGDAAIDDIIHAFREAQRAYPRPDARHRIEHSQTIRDDQLDEVRELGITPSFFVGHVYYWGDRHRDIFLGPERAARISPLASAAARGIRFTIHDDTPVTPVRPIQLVWVAANRVTSGGRVLGPEQRIPVEQALRAITIDAAWQNFEEDIKGSIEVGKLADLVLLSENPLMVDPAAIKDIQVLETIVGGRSVFVAGDEGVIRTARRQ
jgi:predicted amidohydrolase YtcJ